MKDVLRPNHQHADHHPAVAIDDPGDYGPPSTWPHRVVLARLSTSGVNGDLTVLPQVKGELSQVADKETIALVMDAVHF